MTSDAPPAVSCVIDDDGIARITIDDGKANAISHAVLADVNQALDRAQAGARAVVLSGRPGRFSAGFDLSVMQEGPESARELVRGGAELALRFYELPLPVVMACTGHALAMGAILLLAGDVRVGADGDFKIGMNEVAIGMHVPVFAVELARDRLTRRQFTPAVSHATIYSPAGAAGAGYLDEVVAPDALEGVALDRARDLADRLNAVAFATTRVNARQATATYIRETLVEDLKGFVIND
jgi:enoyl-CoA hydratase